MQIKDYNDRQGTFSPIPRSLFFFRSSKSDSIFQQLTYLMRNNKNILVLLGEQGVGKTITLIETMNQLDSEIKFFFLRAKHFDFQDIVREFCDRSGFLPMKEGEWPTRQLLDNDLRNNNQKENPYTLIFDDAHRYCDEILRKLLLLSVSPSVKKSAFKIVLSGLPELRTRIDQLNLHPVQKEAIDYYGLENMEPTDVASFIRQPKNTARPEEVESYTPKAISRIYHHSKGNPGLITKLCGLARTLAGIDQKSVITAELIDKVAEKLFPPPNQKATEPQERKDSTRTTHRVANNQQKTDTGAKKAVQTGRFSSKINRLKSEYSPGNGTHEAKKAGNKKRAGFENTVQHTRVGPFRKRTRYFAMALPVLILSPIYFAFNNGNTLFPRSSLEALEIAAKETPLNANQEKLVPDVKTIESSADITKKMVPAPTTNHKEPAGGIARQFIYDLRNSNQTIDLAAIYNKAKNLGTQNRLEDAYLLYFYAARQGSGISAFRLAQLHDPAFFKPGISMIEKPSLSQASKWYGLAANAGYAAANPFLEKIRIQIFDRAATGDEEARRLTVQY